MSEVYGNCPVACPSCGEFVNPPIEQINSNSSARSFYSSINLAKNGARWSRIAIGNESSAGEQKYSIGKGILGGLFAGQVGTLAGFAPTKGTLKAIRYDTFKCPFCGHTENVKVDIFW